MESRYIDTNDNQSMAMFSNANLQIGDGWDLSDCDKVIFRHCVLDFSIREDDCFESVSTLIFESCKITCDVTIKDCQHVVLRDCIFGDEVFNYGDRFTIDSADTVVLENCSFLGSCDIKNCRNVAIRSEKPEEGEYNVGAISFHDVENLFLESLYTESGLTIEDCESITLRNCTVEQSDEDIFEVSSADTCKIENCYFRLVSDCYLKEIDNICILCSKIEIPREFVTDYHIDIEESEKLSIESSTIRGIFRLTQCEDVSLRNCTCHFMNSSEDSVWDSIEKLTVDNCDVNGDWKFDECESLTLRNSILGKDKTEEMETICADYADHITIEDCDFSGQLAASNCRRLVLRNSTFQDGSMWNISEPDEIVVDACTIKNFENRFATIELFSAPAVIRIEDCQFTQCGMHTDAEISDPDAGGIFYITGWYGPEKLIVRNNQVQHCYIENEQEDMDVTGIFISGDQDISVDVLEISGNVFSKCRCSNSGDKTPAYFAIQAESIKQDHNQLNGTIKTLITSESLIEDD